MKLFYEKMNNFDDLAAFIRGNTTAQLGKEVALAAEVYYNPELKKMLQKCRDISQLDKINMEYLTELECYAFASAFENTATVKTFLIHLKKSIEKFATAYELMEDEISKDTFFNTLLFRLMPYNQSFLEKVRCHGHEYYQKDLLPAEEGGVFLDCGAYDGLTAREYAEAFDSYTKIYSFEPEPNNFLLLQKGVEQMENVVCLNKGVGEKGGQLNFVPCEDGSRVHPTGSIEVPIVSIDEEIKEPVTFIKMDIEGIELLALKGAREHLVNDRPFLAICVYHLMSDYHKITLYLQELLPDYVFNLRHHGDLNWAAPQYGTVLYGCPKEKQLKTK